MLYHEAEYKSVFDEADKDKDGYITYQDLLKLVLFVDHMFPEDLIKKTFHEAKRRIPPADKMDLDEFMDAMGRLNWYRSVHVSTHKGPILHSSISGNISRWLNNPRFARYIYEAFFMETDTDHDGFITFEEFQAQTKKYDLQYLDRTVQLEMKKHNTRKDGYMNLVDFMIAMGFRPLGDVQIKPKPAPEPVKAEPPKKPKGPKFQLGASLLRQIFMSMDQDGDGVLNKQEIKQVFQQLGQDLSDDDVEELIRSQTRRGDGTLTFDEFINYAMPISPSRVY